MRLARFFVLAVVLVTLVVPTAAAKERKVRTFRQGEVFCPSKKLLLGNVIVEKDQCFKLAVLRERRGAFLAFVDPALTISRDQPVFLDTPFGFKVRERIVVLVPIQTTREIITVIPLNAIRLAPVRVEDFDTRLTIILLRPSLIVVLRVRS